MDEAKRSRSTTTDGAPPRPGCEDLGAPAPIGPNGQHGAYWILSAEERAKGFVRPVRRSYVHARVPGPRFPTRELTAEEAERFAGVGYSRFEPYPPSEAPLVGRYWTDAELARWRRGCGSSTTMSTAIAETYAREPSYYGSTFCVACGAHYPVAEFLWEGSPEVLGS